MPNAGSAYNETNDYDVADDEEISSLCEYSIYTLSQYTYIIALDIVSITAELSDVEADFSPFSCCTSALLFQFTLNRYTVQLVLPFIMFPSLIHYADV